MAAIIPLYQLMRLNVSNFSRYELFIVEAELFIRICQELTEIFRESQKDYFCLLKLTKKMENTMLEFSFIPLMIQDILSTQEYSLQGVAEYIDFHEDVVIDIIAGKIVFPSSILLKRIIELHRSVRPELYQAIMKKILGRYES